ncbi:carboxylic ester hydrolase [Aureococcus anophagefferens]|nr:carboxylic ester hydrolase [Aureococcus anophagefferens]
MGRPHALRDFDEAFLDRVPDAGVAFEPCAAGFWSLPPDPAPSVVVLFLHGGSYSAYAPDDPWYRALASRIAAASRVAVLSARYRLAPAHPFPAALDDARAALAAARDRAGRVVLFGDSAGAGLAAALALEGGAAGLAALSGLFDLTASGRSYATRRFRGGGGDPIFRDGPDEERRSTIATASCTSAASTATATRARTTWSGCCGPCRGAGPGAAGAARPSATRSCWRRSATAACRRASRRR